MARAPAGLPRGMRLSDHVTLGVLSATVPGPLIDAVLTETGRDSVRHRRLPARLMVYYVMALALYAQSSYGEVLRCLVEGVRWLGRHGADWSLAGKSAITQARTRLGVEPMKALFARVAGPVAAPDTPGAWYRGQRLVAIDGTTLDLADTPDVEAHFGRPPASRGAIAFPQARLVTLVETGTHALLAAAFARYETSEHRLAPAVLEHLRPGMLCLADRGLFSYTLWRSATRTGADLLWRVRTHQQTLPCVQPLTDGSYLSRVYASTDHRHRDVDGITVRVIDYRLDGVPGAAPLYRLITTRLDPATAPAAELAALYHERWEAEGVFAELKVTLPGERLMLRSRRADLVEQELYGLLLVHIALRRLMAEAAQADATDPDHLSFVHAIRVVRRHLPFHAAFSPSAAPHDARPHPRRTALRARLAQPRPP